MGVPFLVRSTVWAQGNSLAEHFGLNAPSLQRDIDALRDLYQLNRDRPTIQIKRQLWEDLLRRALGEVARTPGQMDELFVRHSYLTAVIGMVVQASFGIDLRAKPDRGQPSSPAVCSSSTRRKAPPPFTQGRPSTSPPDGAARTRSPGRT